MPLLSLLRLLLLLLLSTLPFACAAHSVAHPVAAAAAIAMTTTRCKGTDATMSVLARRPLLLLRGWHQRFLQPIHSRRRRRSPSSSVVLVNLWAVRLDEVRSSVLLGIRRPRMIRKLLRPAAMLVVVLTG